MSYSEFFAKCVFRVRFLGQKWVNSATRNSWLRIQGMEIGRKTSLSRCIVTWPHQVKIGANCIIEHDVYFKFDGPWMPGPRIFVGNNVFIGAQCEFNIKCKIQVDESSAIASGCRFIDHNHDRSLSGFESDENCESRPIHVERQVWVGANSIILSGVTLGEGSIVGAGAVVTRSIPPFEIWAGVPARKIGMRS